MAVEQNEQNVFVVMPDKNWPDDPSLVVVFSNLPAAYAFIKINRIHNLTYGVKTVRQNVVCSHCGAEKGAT